MILIGGFVRISIRTEVVAILHEYHYFGHLRLAGFNLVRVAYIRMC